MKHLSDLMEEAARQDAPPLRRSVDEVVAAGRRRQRRQTAAWVSVAAVAVVAAIGVPQVLTPRAESVNPPAGSPPASPSATRSSEVAYTFRGFAAGRFRVADPTAWRPAVQQADILDGAMPVGNLTVYNDGVDPRRIYPDAQVTAADPVGGRQAVTISATRTMLAWEYADGQWALAASAQDMSLSDARQVAEAFKPSPAHAITVPLRVRSLPEGYRVAAVTIVGENAVVTLAPEAVARAIQDHPNHRTDVGVLKGLGFEIHPRSSSIVKPTGREVLCTETAGAQSCAKLVAGSRYVVQANGAPTSTRVEARRLLDAVSVTDPAVPSTWVALNEAFPASAQPYRD
ncbi:hypothetical protein ACQPZJ_01140 [Actinoplanes sp. CA-054009]